MNNFLVLDESKLSDGSLYCFAGVLFKDVETFFQSEAEFIVIKNKYQTTQYKVMDSYRSDKNIVIHVIRLNSNNQYNIIMSDNTIEIVCTSCDDGTRVVFVLKETKNNFF